jgi:hypothetical protein
MAESTSRPINSVLVLDDEPDNLRVVSEMLGHRLTADITQTRFPSDAIRLATQRCFDLIFVDVSLNYRGSPFGGMDVYGELLPRYGSEAIIAYSEVVTDGMLRRYPFVNNFVDKHVDPVLFADELADTGRRLRERQSCFVAMPFSKNYDDLFETLRLSIEDAGFHPVRVDQQEFTASILERVLSEIRRAKLVLFVATDRNPNAFYECGYAVALNKEVVTVTDELSNLPFDVRDRNAIAYGLALDGLRSSIQRRLIGITKPL